MRMPQLRLIAVDYCDSKCIYCRPSGEAVLRDDCIHSLSLDTAIRIAKLYKENGGNDIKITGGDPVYWEHLGECIRILKNDLRFENVGIVTKSVKIVDIIDDLVEKGIDSIIFSLDTLEEDKYKKITGKNDFNEFLDAINYCSKKTYCKINMVVMKGVNDDEIDNMINFCKSNDIKELKLLDLISDLHESKINNSSRLDDNYNTQLQDLYMGLDHKSKYLADLKPSVLFQKGGIGHPQKFYRIDNLNVVLKDANNGAWYGECCENCKMYPCHDALMGLRLLPNNSFQICLLNEEQVYKFNKNNEEQVLKKCLSFYKNAKFIKK